MKKVPLTGSVRGYITQYRANMVGRAAKMVCDKIFTPRDSAARILGATTTLNDTASYI